MPVIEQSTSPPGPYTNPYEHLTPEQTTRFSINLSNEDAEFFRRIRPGTGLVQTTLAILVKALKTSLTNSGIIEYDPERYEQFVGGCAVVGPTANASLSRSPVADSNSPSDSLPAGRHPDNKAANRNDGRRASNVPRSAPAASGVVSDASIAPSGQAEARKRKGKAT